MTTVEEERESTDDEGWGEDGDEGRVLLSDPFDRDVLPVPKGASPALLRSLLSPRRLVGVLALAAVLLLLQQAAVQAGPLLVAYAIDRAVPALRDGAHGPLIAVGTVYLGCALASGALQYAFIRVSARTARTCCWICAAGSSATPRR
ncbi:ABC transporter OS=Streptomyces antimycoticus OX=68175 GN=SSPO_035560 PE=4 SV=1 [Streptomyces antimycoticus]